MVNWNILGKYGIGGVTLVSVFYLTYIGKVDPQVYLSLVTGVLAGLGINVISGPSSKGDK